MSWTRSSTKRVVALVGLGGLAGAVLHFLFFVVVATRQPVNTHGKADGIVVLTGGSARLGEAGRLLREGWGRRLLISGVNPRVQRDDLMRLTGLDETAFGCCVDTGYAARDTIGNAGETRAWAEANRFRRLIVVTAAYHMPRSMAELAHAMPDIALEAHAVVPRDFSPSAGWRNIWGIRVLVGEYFKLLSATLRLSISSFSGADRAVVPGTPNQARHAVHDR